MDKLPRGLFNFLCLSNKTKDYDENDNEDGDHQFRKKPGFKQMLEHFEETTDQVLYELSLRNMAALTIS